MTTIRVTCTPEAARTIGKRLPGEHAAAQCAIEILADVAEEARGLAYKFRSYRCDACFECSGASADVDPETCDCGCHDTARRARRILHDLRADV